LRSVQSSRWHDSRAEIPPTREAIALPVAALEDYVGTHKLADDFLLKVFRSSDELFAQATGQGTFPIFPSAVDEFFTRIAGISISFTRDSNGAVDGLVLHQNGDRKAPKLILTPPT
jgi:serine-type D-Ala-D-Ala carboxypeptidase/endopeptidase